MGLVVLADFGLLSSPPISSARTAQVRPLHHRHLHQDYILSLKILPFFQLFPQSSVTYAPFFGHNLIDLPGIVN